MKWAGPAAVIALVFVIFGVGAGILFVMGPAAPKAAPGDEMLTLSDSRPTFTNGAAWLVCSEDSSMRLVADGRSPGPLRVKLRQMRSINGPGAIISGSRRLAVAVSAKPQGWFDRFVVPVEKRDLPALLGASDFGLFVADQTVRFHVTADAPSISAFVEGCGGRQSSSPA